MVREEFSKFMKKQITEIKKYTETKHNFDKNCDKNNCAFEWIDSNAKTFSDKWNNKE
jgi:hypothetical protein